LRKLNPTQKYNSHWTSGLSRAQVKTIKRIRVELSGASRKDSFASDGWTIYRIPSTREATYLELRHHLTDGGLARWVIETNGEVSFHNDLGMSPALLPNPEWVTP
jgi:hypothetical protein